MSRYPKAKWRPVDRYQSGPLHVSIKPRRLILHTAVTNASSLFDMFNKPDTPTSHFYVAKDGTVEQYIDTEIRGTANLDGNHDCIGVETWDGFGASWNGGGEGPRWTDAQVEALANLAAWCNTEHGIPLKRLPSSRTGTQGVGWHRLGIDGNFPSGLLAGRVAGGEHWSTSGGKVCPTNTRIKQTVLEVIPRACKVGNEPKGTPGLDKDIKRLRRARANAQLHRTRQALTRLIRSLLKRKKS